MATIRGWESQIIVREGQHIIRLWLAASPGIAYETVSHTVHPEVAHEHLLRVKKALRKGATPMESRKWRFVSELVGTDCSVCGEPQHTSYGGDVCKNGHGGAPSVESLESRIIDSFAEGERDSDESHEGDES